MRIGIIGSGGVAQTLAAGFLKHEHDVTLGTRHQPGMDDGDREQAVRGNAQHQVQRQPGRSARM